MAGLNFTRAQQLTLEVTPKVTGTLSFVGSCSIIYEIWRLKPSKRQVTHHILLCMSIVDAFNSFAMFLATWPIPKPYGSGNIATCNAQGFVIQFAICILFWNAALASAFLLKIKYNWTDYQVRKLLPYFHVVIWGFAFSTAVAALVLKAINDATLWCWIAPIKEGRPNPDGRGENASVYQFAFFYIPLWILMIYVCWAMYMLWDHVATHEKEMKRHGFRRSGSGRTSKRVGYQALWYSGAMMLTWIFGTLNRVTQLFGFNIFGLLFLHSFFVPAQGFSNYLVYKYPQHGFVRKTLKRLCCCICDSVKAASSHSRHEPESKSEYVPTKFPLAEQRKRKDPVNTPIDVEAGQTPKVSEADLNNSGSTFSVREGFVLARTLLSRQRSKYHSEHSSSSISNNNELEGELGNEEKIIDSLGNGNPYQQIKKVDFDSDEAKSYPAEAENGQLFAKKESDPEADLLCIREASDSAQKGPTDSHEESPPIHSSSDYQSSNSKADENMPEGAETLSSLAKEEEKNDQLKTLNDEVKDAFVEPKGEHCTRSSDKNSAGNVETSTSNLTPSEQVKEDRQETGITNGADLPKGSDVDVETEAPKTAEKEALNDAVSDGTISSPENEESF
mmetsp:Transcript_5549/g.6349  ORF Transcript_5549/g.6349 Transcript_5549/m.6349 type:complete len:617 (-) Transcript_5549:351-2201(-)